MLDYTNFLKKTTAYSNVLIDFDKERIAHTYLIENQDMNLCFSFAKMLTSLIIKGKDTDSVFEGKLEKNIHPDVKVYGLEKKIMADNATEIVSDVFVMPYEEDRKVYILLGCDDMNSEAQNKLLKTLEEPPVSSYFILCTRNEKTLLQTIISRSKKIEVENPTSEEIACMLEKISSSDSINKIISVSCSNNASKAEKMVGNSSFVKLYDNVFEMFMSMNSSKDILKFIPKFSTRDFDVLDFLNVVETVARDVVYVISGTDKLIQNKHKLTELRLIASTFSVSALAKILKECFDFRESLYYNVSITPALDEFLLKFVEVKVKCKK